MWTSADKPPKIGGVRKANYPKLFFLVKTKIGNL
jgi:hypothetical protein